jgi:hypothetical protein
MATATCTGAISAPGVLTAASVTGTIPGGGAANLTLQIGLSASGGLNGVFFASLFGPLSLGSGVTNFTAIGSGGSGYVPGTYTNVPLTSQLGVATGILATIVVTLGNVTSCVITAGGENNIGNIATGIGGYEDSLTTPNSNLGGTGSGFYLLTNSGGNSLASSAAIAIDAYGTGGTSGTGAAGTYQTTALGAANNPTTIVGNVSGNGFTVTSANWAAWSTAPPSTYSPPLGQMQPVPNVAIAGAKPAPVTGTYATSPPVPLPQTLIGTTNISTYSI